MGGEVVDGSAGIRRDNTWAVVLLSAEQKDPFRVGSPRPLIPVPISSAAYAPHEDSCPGDKTYRTFERYGQAGPSTVYGRERLTILVALAAEAGSLPGTGTERSPNRYMLGGDSQHATYCLTGNRNWEKKQQKGN